MFCLIKNVSDIRWIIVEVSKVLKSKNHRIGTYGINKISWSFFDNNVIS